MDEGSLFSGTSSLELQRKRKLVNGASAAPSLWLGKSKECVGPVWRRLGGCEALISRCAADQSTRALENSTGPQLPGAEPAEPGEPCAGRRREGGGPRSFL